MNPKPLSQARDEDARHVLAALERAAMRAREIAAQTRTAVIFVHEGKLIREYPSLTDFPAQEPNGHSKP